MILFWAIPLAIITLSGMTFLLLRGRPKSFECNLQQTCVLILASSCLLSLADLKMPSPEVVVRAWAIAGLGLSLVIKEFKGVKLKNVLNVLLHKQDKPD